MWRIRRHRRQHDWTGRDGVATHEETALALARQRELTAHIVSAAPTIIVAISPEGITRAVNRAVTEVTGYEPNELLGRNWWPIFYPGEDYAQVEQLYRDFDDSSQQVRNYDMVLTAKDGTKRTISWNSVNRLDPSGRLIEIIGIGADITDRSNAERLTRTQRDLGVALSASVNLKHAFRATLAAALPVAGLEEGAFYEVDPATSAARFSVAHTANSLQSVTADDFAGLNVPLRQAIETGKPVYRTSNGSKTGGNATATYRAVAVLPVVDDERVSACLVAASRTTACISAFARQALEALAVQVSHVVARHRVEQALRDADAHLREITATVPGAVYQFRLSPDDSRSFPFISDGVTELVEVSPLEVHTDAEILFRIVSPEDRDRLEESIRRSAETLSPWKQELRVITPSGKLKWLRGHSVPQQRLADGTILWNGVLTDITEQRQAQEALRRQALVFDNMHDGALVTDLNGRITAWNRGSQRMFGYTREEILGKSPELLNRSDEAAALTQEIQTTLDRDGRWAGEIAFVNKSGQEGVCEAVVVPLFDERNRHIATVAVNRDVTGRKHAEQRAREHQAELARVSRFSALGEMTGGLAHELNQPLAALCNYVAGCLRRMRVGREVTPEVLRAMKQAIAQANRAAAIIQRVRELVRQGDSTRRDVDVNALIREVVALDEVKSLRGPSTIRLALARRLPHIWADAIQIEQLILNLVCNGLEAVRDCAPGSGALRIASSVSDAGEVIVEVRDNGRGLSEARADSIFDPFFSTKHDGLGLGLSICRSIIQRYGGRIGMKSNAKGGMTFFFALPAVKEGPCDAG